MNIYKKNCLGCLLNDIHRERFCGSETSAKHQVDIEKNLKIALFLQLLQFTITQRQMKNLSLCHRSLQCKKNICGKNEKYTTFSVRTLPDSLALNYYTMQCIVSEHAHCSQRCWHLFAAWVIAHEFQSTDIFHQWCKTFTSVLCEYNQEAF